MQSGPEDRLALIRHYYEAYERDDRSLIEPTLHPEFTFSSPNDDNNIDLDLYFARCWPNHDSITHFDLLDICADDEHALIRYHASTSGGSAFSNVERFDFRDGLISHVDCYFGPALPEQTTTQWGAAPA